MKLLLNTLTMSLVAFALSTIGVFAEDYPEPPMEAIEYLFEGYPQRSKVEGFNMVFGEGKAEEILKENGLEWPVKEELPEMTTVQIASETANKIIPTGKLITSFQNSFVMIHQGNVYLCIIGNSPRVACYLNK